MQGHASLGVGWLGEGAFAQLLVLRWPALFSATASLHLLAAALAFGRVVIVDLPYRLPG